MSSFLYRFFQGEKKKANTMQQVAVNLHSRVSVGNKTVRVQQRLGNGAFGVVYKVIDVASGEVYALKDVLCSGSTLRNAVREATTLKKISHENVIAIIGADQCRDTQGLHMLLLTEYCPGGSLNERLALPSSDKTNLKWMSQIAAALAHLHSQGVVHRDLKADNVLLTATGDVKLADFGLAREYIALKRNDAQQDDGSWMTSYTQYYMTSGTFPIHWAAPEFFICHYTDKADVFSLGTLFFAILERDFIVIDGKPNYGAFVDIPGVGKVGIGYAMAMVDRRTRISFSWDAQGSYDLQRIILKTLQYDKNDRPSASQVYGEIINIYKMEHMLEQPQLESPIHRPFCIQRPSPDFSSTVPPCFSSTPPLSFSSTPPLSFSSTPPLSFSSTPPLSFSSTPPLSFSSTPPPSFSSTPPPRPTPTPSPDFSSTVPPWQDFTSFPPPPFSSTPPLSFSSTPLLGFSSEPPRDLTSTPPPVFAPTPVVGTTPNSFYSNNSTSFDLNTRLHPTPQPDFVSVLHPTTSPVLLETTASWPQITSSQEPQQCSLL